LPVLSEPVPCGSFSSGSSRGLLSLAVRLSSRPGLSSLVQCCIASRLCGPNPLPFRASRLYSVRAGLLACLRLATSASLPPWDFIPLRVSRSMNPSCQPVCLQLILAKSVVPKPCGSAVLLADSCFHH
jgi:hypothetical protein